MTDSAILEVQGVTKRFGGLTALDDVSMAFDRGQIYSLIGPNGAGKTTLFNCITGYLAPTNGTVSFNGDDITGLSPVKINKSGIARTFQIVRAFEGMTVRDNVKVGAYFGQANRNETVDNITDRVLETCKLEDFAEDEADTLSIGDAKRLEVAKAYATDPEFLLADEPSAGLNPAESKTLIDILERIRDNGVTICLVEHDMDTVMEISDQIFVLNNGQLISEGPPEEVANDPAVIDAYLGTGQDPEADSTVSKEGSK